MSVAPKVFDARRMTAEQLDRVIAKQKEWRAFYESLEGCQHCGRPKPSIKEAYRMFTDAQQASPAASISSQ